MAVRRGHPTWTCAHEGLAAGDDAETVLRTAPPPAKAGSTARVKVSVRTTSREVFTSNNTGQAVVMYYAALPPDLAVRLSITPTEAVAGTTLYLDRKSVV
jgi:hypothetical protein